MGLFSRKKANNKEIDTMLIGWFRTEAEKLTGKDSNSKEYQDALVQASPHIENLMTVVDKQVLTDIGQTFVNISPARYQELMGEFAIVLWTRFAVIMNEVTQGRLDKKDLDLDRIAMVLHENAKNVIKALKSR